MGDQRGVEPMTRTKKSFAPGVDVMEARTLLTTAAPLLAVRALDGVVHEVRSIMGRLVRTGDTGRATAALSTLSSTIPLGTQYLAPAWRSDIALYRSHVPGSAAATQRRLLDALYLYDQLAVGGGESPVTGPGATSPTGQTPAAGGSGNSGGTGAPAPALSLDSVTIQNTTGQALLVTVYLRVPQVQQPWITQVIPANDTQAVAFNFGTSTGSFMTMNVSLASGSQSPPPLSNLSLDQPIGGYNGTSFTISLFGPYFNITPG